MPSLDEMLDAIGKADDDAEDTDADVTTAKPNSAIKAIRDHAKKLERELEKTRKAYEDLEAWKEQRVQEDSTNALKAAGLSPRQAEVFLKFYGEVTPEAISEFRRDVLGNAPAGEAAPEASSEFRPTGSVGDSGGGDKLLTREQLRDLSPEEQIEAVRAGRVQFRS